MTNTKLYASAIMATRNTEYIGTVYVARGISLKVARMSALDDAKARWPRKEGWVDHQETTMEIPQHFLFNTPIGEKYAETD